MASRLPGPSIPTGHGHGLTSLTNPSDIKSPLEAPILSPGTIAGVREVDENAKQAGHADDERVSNLFDNPRRSAPV